MRRIATLAVVVAALAGALVLAGASGPGDGGRRYKVELDNAFGLVEGGDFRIAGVPAGQTTGFEIKKRKGHATKAVVTAEIDKPGFDDLRQDASCEVRPQSLIGEYFLTCQTGSSPKKLPKDGTGTVPVQQTASTIPTDLVNDVMRRPTRERLRLILTELGTGLAGRPRDLQAVLKRAHPGLRETSRVLRILGNQNRVIEDFIRNSDTVVGELEANKRDVARWVVEAGDAAEISASRRQALRQNFRKLPLFLGELRPTMARLGQLADEQMPMLRDVRRATPSLTRFFRLLGPFSEASRPALRSLGETSKVGTRAFKEGAQEVRELRTLARDAPASGPAPNQQGFAKPLRQFLATMDDRTRAFVNDPRAKASAPPAPDPTAIPANRTGGFTGLEAIANYAFWQALSINRLDGIGHALSLVAVVNDCVNYETGPLTPDNAARFKKCNGWLGPYQPGVNAPDPTERGTASVARARARDRKPARRLGERRGPGQPEAGPLPGQRDASKPQIVLPPALSELLDRVGPGRPLPGADERGRGLPGGGDDRAESQLLDYLLGP
jgi:phospholipid/cholesterol/gamma-HCH transport system substrate-binding protein